VTGDDLTREQVEQVMRVLSVQSRYLHGLKNRMWKVGFRDDDPLRQRANRAAQAVVELLDSFRRINETGPPAKSGLPDFNAAARERPDK
jgi:hypothetical protein